MKKRDVLFLCQYSYPEYNSSATLPFDTATYLASQGKTVSIICGYPKEYTEEKKVPLREEKNGVSIRRVRYLQLSRTGKIGRLINYFSFTMAAFLHIFALRKFRSVIVYSNPPILPVVTILANILFKTKFIFVAYDIYPEVAYISHSVEAGSKIDRVMRHINHQLYKRASLVVALTEEMKQFILVNRPEIPPERVCVISNWAHEGRQVSVSKPMQLFDYNEEQFIVSYFGNLGICQDIETILSAIHILKDDTLIRFFIAGYGPKMAEFREKTKELDNIIIADFMTGEKFENAVAICSCCIVSLEPGLMGTCAPSKYYSYLQGGCPIISIAEDDSYLAKEVQSEKIGFHVRNGDGAGLAAVIRELSHDQRLCLEMGHNAQNLYNNKYARHIAMQKYDDAVSQLLHPDTLNGSA